MTGRACHDDVYVVSGTLDPWPPFKYGNQSFCNSESSVPSFPSDLFPPLKQTLTKHARTLRLESACSGGRIVSVQESTHPGPRRIDMSMHARPRMQLHVLPVSTGLRVAAICVRQPRASHVSPPARVAATCFQPRALNWLIPKGQSEPARLPALAGTLKDDIGKAGCRGPDRER